MARGRCLHHVSTCRRPGTNVLDAAAPRPASSQLQVAVNVLVICHNPCACRLHLAAVTPSISRAVSTVSASIPTSSVRLLAARSQSVEFISLLALLYRARHDLFNPSTLTSLSGTCVGTFTTLAWTVLPYAQWLRLANASKLVRYLFYMNAKLMIGYLGFPAPPGIVSYQLGPGMLVMEGIILPSSNLIHPAAATLLALAKVPLAVAMMTESGAAKSSREALPPLLFVALMSVVVTVLWHLQLRVSFARWKGRQGAVRRKVKFE